MLPEQVKAHMKAHKVYYVVSWELPREEWGSDAYFAHDAETAKRIVTEKINDGSAVCQFFRDEHDFGEGNNASITSSMPWDQTPAEVLRMVADQLDEEDGEAVEEDGEKVDCTP